jgi:hypothetical protein
MRATRCAVVGRSRTARIASASAWTLPWARVAASLITASRSWRSRRLLPESAPTWAQPHRPARRSASLIRVSSVGAHVGFAFVTAIGISDATRSRITEIDGLCFGCWIDRDRSPGDAVERHSILAGRDEVHGADVLGAVTRKTAEACDDGFDAQLTGTSDG